MRMSIDPAKDNADPGLFAGPDQLLMGSLSISLRSECLRRRRFTATSSPKAVAPLPFRNVAITAAVSKTRLTCKLVRCFCRGE